MEELVSNIFPDEFVPVVTQILSQLMIFVLVVIGLLVAWNFAKRYFAQGRAATSVSMATGRRNVGLLDDPDPLDPFAVPALEVPRAARPTDGAYFDVVLRFATDKQSNGTGLIPEENFALGPVAFIVKLLGPNGFDHLDEYRDELPFRGWALRQAAERIGAPKFAEPLEQVAAVFLHRQQLYADMTATGMPADEALAHPDRPSYDKIAALLGDAGGLEAFVAAANTYFLNAYPWSDQSGAETGTADL